MNIRDQRKSFYLSVKKVIHFWEKGGLKMLKIIFDDERMIVEKGSWVEKVKELLKEKKYHSLEAEIALVSRTFKYHKDESKDEGNKQDEANSIQGGSRVARNRDNRFDPDSDGGSENN